MNDQELLHTSDKADDLIGMMFVLPPHGGVVLKAYMGSDASVVEAARTSYQKGTKVLRSDEGLIHYMAGRRREKCPYCDREAAVIQHPAGAAYENGCDGVTGYIESYTHSHSSPFEQVILKFWIKLPIFLERQMIRHRTARINEMSGRYSEMPDEFWDPLPEEAPHQDPDTGPMVYLRGQDTKNKQGSKGQVAIPAQLYDAWMFQCRESHRLYVELLRLGVAKELARAHLPLSLYTQKIWQMDLNNLSRYLMLRLDSHTQQEHRDYAQIIAYLAHAVAPISVEALAKSQGWLETLEASINRRSPKD